MPATINSMIPAKLGCGSQYPRRDNPELMITKAATKKSKPPATRAADFSATAESGLERNRQGTMIAENSSMTLSPPNPRRAGLLAVHDATSATTYAHPGNCEHLKTDNMTQ